MSTIKISASDHVLGDINAPIELVEYGDYQCSYCGQAYYIVKDLQKKLGKKLKFIFRNYPLEDLHPYAVHAALAAEAAHLQNRFWEMHDVLYENQRRLDDSSIISYARDMGLDTRLFEKEFGSEETVKKLQEDVASGDKAGVRGTPTFFVNGKKYDGNWADAEFLRYLELLI